MFKIGTLNAISDSIYDPLPADQFEVSKEVEGAQGILVRSASMHEMDFDENLLAIARAGAGVNNIPLDKASEKGIVVFNTPGANANAVKELVLAGLLLSSRKIAQGIDWARTLKGQGAQVGKLVEKGKGQFVGPELKGKKLGVVGLGAIGVMVANAATAFGMDVYGYDPYISVKSAWGVSRAVHYVKSIEAMVEECDYITIHVPLADATRGMFNADLLGRAKDGLRLLNFARGELVDTPAVLAALQSGKLACYVTDFPNDDLLCVDNVICIPHLGASTPESEENCAHMAAEQIADYLQNGNIVNSVNFPHLEMPRVEGTFRIGVVHKNVSKMIGAITGTIGQYNINIDNMLNKSRGELAYTLIESNHAAGEDVLTALKGIEGVIRVLTF